MQYTLVLIVDTFELVELEGSLRASLCFLVACAGAGEGDDSPPATAPVAGFQLTVAGPAFPDAQHFQVDQDRLFWNVGSDHSLALTFTGGGDGVVSDDGTFVLDLLSGGVGPGVIEGEGTIPLGENATGRDGWSIIIWPTGCGDGYVGCDRVNVATLNGTMEVSAFRLGESISRPDAEGPTYIGATFEAAAEELDEPYVGRAYDVEGSFYLEE